MAAGGVTESSGQKFQLPVSNITLTVMEGNIVETSALSVATGEDLRMGGHGGVSQLLIKTCPPAYQRAREELKKNTKKFEFSKVYPCAFPPVSQSAGGVSFNVVLHAIVPALTGGTRVKDWKEQMKLLYFNLLKAANNQGRSSLALPVLGSGQAGASIDVAVDVLVLALTTFRLRPSDRHLLRDIILYARKDAFGKTVSKLQAKLKALSSSQPNGIAPPSHVTAAKTRTGNTRPGSGVDQTRPPSSSNIRNPGSARGRGGRGSGRKPPAGRAAAAAPAMAKQQQTNDDGLSNMGLILQGLTLESTGNTGSSTDQQQEEPMDCDERIVKDNDDDAAKNNGNYDEEEEEKGEEEEEEEKEEEEEEEEEDRCAICLDEMKDPKQLDKCGHWFCRDCIDDSFKQHKPVCPNCNTVYGMITGNQPRGTMSMSLIHQGLPGYDNCGQIVIDYEFPSGLQGPEHSNPGQPYHGTGRRAFLPDCREGKKVYRLLRVAFENRLTFTIGRSVTTGMENVVTWNDIHHKTRTHGGATGFGYPDPQYLSRVQEELAVKGITEESLEGRTFDL